MELDISSGNQKGIGGWQRGEGNTTKECLQQPGYSSLVLEYWEQNNSIFDPIYGGFNTLAQSSHNLESSQGWTQ